MGHIIIFIICLILLSIYYITAKEFMMIPAPVIAIGWVLFNGMVYSFSIAYIPVAIAASLLMFIMLATVYISVVRVDILNIPKKNTQTNSTLVEDLDNLFEAL